MIDALALPTDHFVWLILICFVAGMVRGFSGFALSAVVMAIAVMFLAPITLIPILWFQEMTASLLMVRGGMKDANRRVVTGLVLGSAFGLPIGLSLTQSLPVDTSKLVALSVIVVLAATQLAKLRLPVLATRPGLWGSGILAGIVTGLAGVGGMVVALYVLASNAPAREMRASLVMFLFASSVISLATLTYFGVMNTESALRGLALAPASALGVIAGKSLFRPAWEPYYKPFCLCLLIGLATLGILRQGIGA
ncbi:sulfite exporter TauE/SafE family protein [Shimia sp.]|jgi:hypothetical protein|uniref:sulfite exporter TauE/SafE family protein n=1 Tax=unclassified Shimia TaxID=2630038 RepID=UPI0025D8E79B|nr:sulfite exporter TauE/SafE family protein [Shimia sp.]MCH2067773.1 sulfite exporter TauE/SafE family protein [Shimia sp.]